MPHQPLVVHCPDSVYQPRRDFFKQAGALALAASGVPLLPDELLAASDRKTPETLVSVLFETLTPTQKKAVCFDWDYVAGKKVL